MNISLFFIAFFIYLFYLFIYALLWMNLPVYDVHVHMFKIV